MADILLYGQAASATVWTNVVPLVYAKRNWSDAWVLLPFVWPETVDEVAAPSVGQAEFISYFGNILRSDQNDWDIYEPYFINGAYIAIEAWNRFGVSTLWHGVVQNESASLSGNTSYPHGKQVFSAYDMKHLLDRKQMFGSHTETGFIDRGLVFNKSSERGLSLEGNRSTAPFDDYGYVFSKDGEQWSNLQILEYIIGRFVNQGEVPFLLVGQYDVLAYIFNEHDLDGMTPLQAINKLIDRKLGVSWVCYVIEGYAYIEVFSTSAVPIVGVGDTYLPENANINDAYHAGSYIVDPQLQFNQLETYDAIRVVGMPLMVCGTFSYAAGTLVKGWTDDAEAAYAIGSSDPEATSEDHDNERKTEKFRAVYQQHEVPADWTGYCGDPEGSNFGIAAPNIFWDGTLDIENFGQWYMPGHFFEDFIPFEVEGQEVSDGKDYRAPFALIKLPQTQEDIDNGVLPKWTFVEGCDAAGFAPANVRMLHGRMAFMVDPQINHQYALNHFEDGEWDTLMTPEIDYETMALTAFFKTDNTVQVYLEQRDLPLGAMVREKRIEMPNAGAWYVVPGTVTDVTDGALVLHEGGLVRNDIATLQQVAAMAATWYSVPRAQLRMMIKTCTDMNPVGSMIGGMLGPEGWTWVNSAVTRRTWSFGEGSPTTLIQTGFDELDVERLGK